MAALGRTISGSQSHAATSANRPSPSSRGAAGGERAAAVPYAPTRIARPAMARALAAAADGQKAIAAPAPTASGSPSMIASRAQSSPPAG